VSSGIAFVWMIAVLCTASAVLLWSRGAQRRSAQNAQRFFDRQMHAAGTRTVPEPMEKRVERARQRHAAQAVKARAGSRALAELDSLMRRADIRNPRAAIIVWAVMTSVAALVCASRVAVPLAFAAIVLSALCFYALLAWRAAKRNQRIVRQLPAFLDGIVRLVAIGHSIPAAFQTAAAGAETPLRQCLDEVMPRVRSGAEIDQALSAVARIYRVREFDLIGAVLRISIKFGGRSDVMLERMASFMRDLEQADRELTALSTETRLSSWVLGLLPVVLGVGVIVMNPRYFDSMWTDTLGRKLVYGAFGLQMLGAYLLYRLARLRA
jgi:tight adherence protein B